MISKFIAQIQTMIESKTYQKKRDTVRIAEQLILFKFPIPQQGPLDDFPTYDKILAGFIKNFMSYDQCNHNNDATWIIGDSIMYGSKGWLDGVDDRLNMSYPGMWIHHMKRVAQDMIPIFRIKGFEPKYIFVGTPGGNNFLCRQEVHYTIDQAIDLYAYLRKAFPKARIIICGLPATIVLYINQVWPQVVLEITQKFIIPDGNTSFLALVEHFRKSNNLFPVSDNSSDCVHISPNGYIEFNNDFQRAKKTIGIIP